MEVIRCNETNLASVILGKGIDLPWRGQKGVCIVIPYDEWFSFICHNQPMLASRTPLDYNRIINVENETRRYNFFMFDCSWALYNEILISENNGKDCTLILPEFPDGSPISYDDVLMRANAMSAERYKFCLDSLNLAKPNSRRCLIGDVRPWNWDALSVCTYIHSFVSSPEKIRFNVEA